MSTIRELFATSGLDRYVDDDRELDFDPAQADQFAVRRYSPGESGARSVAGFSDLEEPIKKSQFAEEVEHEGLPYGTYKMLALGGEKNSIIGEIWSIEDVGDRSKLDEDANLQEEIAALREAVDGADNDRRIEEPDDAFALLAEEVVVGDLDVDGEEIEQLSEVLRNWERATREPSVGLLAYQMAVALVDADEVEMSLRILFAWMETESRGGDVDLLDLAKSGDLADVGEIDLKSVAMLQVLDSPRSMAQEVTSGIAEAVGQEDPDGEPIDLGT